MNEYKIIFHMTNGLTRETILPYESIEEAEADLLKDGRPFKTFYSEVDKERKRFSINLYNVNTIDYVLMVEESNVDVRLVDFLELIPSLDSFTIERILGQITSNETIATALRGASDTIKVLILLNVSDYRKQLLDEADTALGDVGEIQIEKARLEFMHVISNLVSSGEIVLP